MKCVKCHKELREGAKFCTVCGAPQPTAAMESSVETTPQPTAKPATGDISTTRNYLFWQVQPGELARIIPESEFIEYSSAQGLIVNSGTTAYIYKQGELVTTLLGGKYNFVEQHELEQTLDQHTGGLAGGIKKVKRFLANLIFGQSVRQRVEQEEQKELLKANSLRQVIEYLNSDSLYSVVLVQNREFDLILGQAMPTADEYTEFVPISVRTHNYELKVGVRATFKIDNADAMRAQYLTARQTLSTACLAQTVAPQVEAVVQAYLGGAQAETEALQNNGQVSAKCRQEIEDQLRVIDFHGIHLLRIVSITCSNDDLERFFTLSHELYVSEQELDYLHKTNEFKNRLATAVNQQLLQEARTDLELMQSLEQINRDRCVKEEDLERFYIVLSREHRVFEAEDKEKEQQALQEIERTGLLRGEEIEILRDEVERRRQERQHEDSLTEQSREAELQKQQYTSGFALKLMQLKDSIDYEMARTGGEAQIDLAQLAHELELTARKDAYADQRYDINFRRQQQQDEYELKHRKAQQQQDNEQMQFEYDIVRQTQEDQMNRYRQMMEVDAEEEDRASKRRIEEAKTRQEHEFRMHEADVEAQREHNRLRANMTAEQIAAEQLSQLDKDAQAAYFNAGRNMEQERALRQQQADFYEQQMKRDESLNREMRQQIADMAKQTMAAMATMSGNMVENRNEQKREYQDELHREQARHDQHQDRALNYTTRQPAPANSNNTSNNNAGSGSANSNNATQTPTASSPATKGAKTCPKCGKLYPTIERFCADCGCELE